MDLSSFRQHNLLYTDEPSSRYRPGGYHPVTLGDTFKDGRYKVHQSWDLVVFLPCGLRRTQKNKWVALKIQTATHRESRELLTLRILKEHSGGSASSQYIAQLLDSFSHEGPNGVHQCLVFELLGPSINRVAQDYRDCDEKIEPDIIIRMATQLLKAVRFIHSAKMSHGDITGGNIAFTCRKLSSATKEQLIEVLGAPSIESAALKDGTPLPKSLPTQLVKTAPWLNWIDWIDDEIRLLDFGQSFLQGEEPERLAQAGILRAPETIFTDKFDYRVDLWSVGCMIYCFLFKAYPFFYLTGVEELAYQMIGFAEDLPAEWQSKWQSMQAASKRKREVQNDNGITELERKFVEEVHDPSLQPLLPVIQGLMRLLPSDRISVEEALELLERGDAGDEASDCRVP